VESAVRGAGEMLEAFRMPRGRWDEAHPPICPDGIVERPRDSPDFEPDPDGDDDESFCSVEFEGEEEWPRTMTTTHAGSGWPRRPYVSAAANCRGGCESLKVFKLIDQAVAELKPLACGSRGPRGRRGNRPVAGPLR